MLTIFSWLGPLSGPSEMIQRSAVESWSKLGVKPRIILLGREQGVAEFCREKGFEHRPGLEANRGSMPLVGEVFQLGTKGADPEALYAYVEPDLLLNDDFGTEAANIEQKIAGPFLASGREYPLEVTQPLHGRKDFHAARQLASGGVAAQPETMDYFLFTPRILPEFPQFILGRSTWSEWLVWTAISRRVPVIDLSTRVAAVKLCASGSVPVDPDAFREAEIEVAGGRDHLCDLRDADYLFQDGELVKNRSVEYYERRFLHPLLALKEKMFKPIPFPPQ